MVQHSEKSIDYVTYVGANYDAYCASSGATLYCGNSDNEVTLPSQITQLKTLVSLDYTQVLIAAGLGGIGEILLMDANSLTRQLKLQTDSLASFDDFLIIEACD